MSWAVAGVAAFQLVSGAQAAEGIRANARLSKEVADMNAEFAELDAFHAEADGYTQAARYEGQVQHIESSQKVAFAANNVDSSFGTAADVTADTKLTGFLNAMDIKNAAHAKALGYQNEARNDRIAGLLGSAQAEFNAASSVRAGTIGAATTALSGYTRGAGKGSTPGPNPSTGPAGYTGSDMFTSENIG